MVRPAVTKMFGAVLLEVVQGTETEHGFVQAGDVWFVGYCRGVLDFGRSKHRGSGSR
jgi:hypothetical protein